MNIQEQERYKRQTILPQIGTEGQMKFKQARVLVVGAGGLGCPVLQYLVAAGVGTLGVMDFDKVDRSNLQRQILYGEADLGKSKAECAAARLKSMNPHAHIHCHDQELTAGNALDILKAYDLIVDGSDNFRTRYLVNDASVILVKPVVFGSIFQFEGQISVFNYKGGPTYRCLYPESGDAGSCMESGVLGVLPGTVGCLMATEVLKIISGSGEVLRGKLLVYDALKNSFNSFSFNAVAKNLELKSILPFQDECVLEIPEISAEELRDKFKSQAAIQLIDIREEPEYASGTIADTFIPMRTLLDNLNRIPRDIPVILHCQKGSRSRSAVKILQEQGYRNVWSLKKGIEGYLNIL